MEQHRRKHSREHKGIERQGGGLFTALVIVASIVLIGVMIYLSPLGAMIKEHIIDPVAEYFGKEKSDREIVDALKTQDEQAQTPSPSPSQTPDPMKKTVKTVTETPFYILQMGTYLEQARAEEHALQIREMGAAGVIYLDGAVYRVFAAAYADEQSLTRVQAQVRADGFEASPYITESNSVKITLEGPERAITDAETAIAFLSDVPGRLCDMSLSFDKGQLSETELIKSLSDMKKQANEILGVFQTQTEGSMLKPVLNVIEKYSDSISTFLQERDTIPNKELQSMLKKLQIETIIDYIRFFDQK